LLNWEEFHDFPIEEYISFKVLTGDKGDNIDGIPGIGPKRASELIHAYGSAFDIYDNTPLDGKYKYIQNLNDNADLILINYELMDLLSYCEEAIQFPGHDLCEIKEEIIGFLNAT
jgi:DNA polymerase-1